MPEQTPVKLDLVTSEIRANAIEIVRERGHGNMMSHMSDRVYSDGKITISYSEWWHMALRVAVIINGRQELVFHVPNRSDKVETFRHGAWVEYIERLAKEIEAEKARAARVLAARVLAAKEAEAETLKFKPIDDRGVFQETEAA